MELCIRQARTLERSKCGPGSTSYMSWIARPSPAPPDGDMLSLELAIIAVLIVINGLLSMSELAIVSSRPARLEILAQKRVRGARRALVLASDPGKFLSTVQIG